MRTRAALGSIFGSVAVLVIGWQAGATAAHNALAVTSSSSSSTTSGTSTGSSASGSSSSGSTSSGSTSTGGTAKTSTKSGTFTGNTTQTQFGPVQVKITVQSGKITDVTAVQLTNRDGRSVQISNYAAPILRQEVLKAQSAHVSSVGGATYTSQGYLTSLQSAIDKAGL